MQKTTMRVTYAAAGILTVAFALCCSAFAQNGKQSRILDLLEGTWTQNQAQSTNDPINARLLFRRSDKGSLEELRASNTEKPFAEPIVFDGKSHALQTGNEIAWKQIDASRFERVLTIEGKVFHIRRISISADGKTLTEAVETRMPDGKTNFQTVVYERQGGEAQGLIGTWIGKSRQQGNPVEIKYERLDKYSMKVTRRDGQYYTLNLDGKPTLIAGAGTLPYTTGVSKQIDELTFESTLSREASAFMKLKTTVSSDGKSMTMTITSLGPNATGQAGTMVLEKQ